MSKITRKPVISDCVQFFAGPGATPEAAIVCSFYAESGSDTCNLSVCNSGGTWRSETSVPRTAGSPDETAGRGWRFPPHHTQQ